MSGRIAPTAALATATLVSAAGGCSDAPSAELALSDSLYVEIMTELIVLRGDMAAERLPYMSRQRKLDSVEAALVAERGVATEDLYDFARVAGRDPDRMRRLWEKIQTRADSLRPPDTEQLDDDQPVTPGLRGRQRGG